MASGLAGSGVSNCVIETVSLYLCVSFVLRRLSSRWMLGWPPAAPKMGGHHGHPRGTRALLPVSCIVGPGVAVAGSTRVSSLASTHHGDTAVDGDLSTPGSLGEDSREWREHARPRVLGWHCEGRGDRCWPARVGGWAKAALIARAGCAPDTRSTCGDTRSTCGKRVPPAGLLRICRLWPPGFSVSWTLAWSPVGQPSPPRV